mmetsp:Transcript_104613/g.223600  ORF Transcript_104613/g.223600 Transcript_104613/m.223600 type:complete len:384 (-) Transcript_104613:586-1737(-)
MQAPMCRLFLKLRCPSLFDDVSACDDIVDLKNHLDDLGRKTKLTALGGAGLVDILLPHVCLPCQHAINTMPRVVGLLLLCLHLGHLPDAVETAVFRKGHGDDVEGGSEGPHGVLLEASLQVGSGLDSEASRHLAGTAAGHNARIPDQVPNAAVRIVKASLRLVDDHLVPTPHQDGHRLGVGAVLYHEHHILRGAKCELAHAARLAELLRRQLLKPRDYPSSGGNSNELHLHTTDPPHSWELRLVELVVGLIVEAPLADHEVGARILDVFDLIAEVLLLVLVQLLVVLRRADVEFVLRLGFGRLEGASEDGHLCILDVLLHLRVAEVLIDEDATDQSRLLQLATDLPLDLDEVKVHIAAIHICHRQHGLDADPRQLILAAAHHL